MEKDVQGSTDANDLFQVWVDLGKRVRELRRARGWTQVQLAERLGELGMDIHPSVVAKMEGAIRPTAVHELWALARLFGVRYDALLPPAGKLPELDSRIAMLLGHIHMAEGQVKALEQSLQDDAAHLEGRRANLAGMWAELNELEAEVFPEKIGRRSDDGKHPETS